MSTIDLNNLPDHRVSIMPAESLLEQRVRLGKDVVRFAFAMIMVLAILVICLATIFSSAPNPEGKKWAMSIMTGATGGLIGYLVRR